MYIRARSGELVEVVERSGVMPIATRDARDARDADGAAGSDRATLPWPNKSEGAGTAIAPGSAGQRLAATASAAGSSTPTAPPPPLDIANHVLASDGLHLLLVDRDPAQRSAATTLIFARINEYFDMAFIPLPAPCARCGGRDHWVPRRTPQQRQALIAKLEGQAKVVASTSRVVTLVHCCICERWKVLAMVQGVVGVVRVNGAKGGSIDVMAERVVEWDTDGAGWIWQSEIEDCLLRGAHAARTESNGANTSQTNWHDWTAYDSVMGLKVIE